VIQEEIHTEHKSQSKRTTVEGVESLKDFAVTADPQLIAIDLYYANKSNPNSNTTKIGAQSFNQTSKTANKSELNQSKENHRRAFSDFRIIKSQESQKL
jgi:hypothetical protein